jgi:UDPglucose--hexose-1-phosphate uridylyltransferase
MIEGNDLGNISKVLKRLQKVVSEEFPFNFYLYQAGDWYLRLIPRIKTPGGFELGTRIFVNTIDPEKASRQLK